MLSKVTHEGSFAGVEGAHDPALEDGEPVSEARRDKGLEHHDHHLGARHLLLGQSARPTRHLLTALLPPDQSTDDIHNPVKDESYQKKDIGKEKGINKGLQSVP